jgi:hypothetical protein
MRLPAFCLLAILALLQGCLQAPSLVDSAWREANRRAGTPAEAQGPPVVDWSGAQSDPSDCVDGVSPGPHPPARYLPDLDRVEVLSLCAQPLQVLLVHEFLHAIRERARREKGYFLEGADPSEESWVQERSTGI